MNCNAKQLNLCRLIQNSYKSILLDFGETDISNDTVKLFIYNGFSRNVIEEIKGEILENSFFFPEFTLAKNDYKYEIIWNHQGKDHLLIFGKYTVTDKANDCGCEDNSEVINISINDGDTVIDITFSETNIIIGGDSSNVSLEKARLNGNLIKGNIEVESEGPPFGFFSQYSPTEGIEYTQLLGLQKNSNYAQLRWNFNNDFAPEYSYEKSITFSAESGINGSEYFTPNSDYSFIQKEYVDENFVAKEDGFGLSQENFTTEEKEKLAGVESNKFKGKFASISALNLIIGESGAYAYVGNAGEDDKSYIWDDDDNKWVLNSSQATAETPSSIKTKYESNPDTNAYTNAEKTAVSTIANKVDKESGKGLSANDYTTTEKNKLLGIATGANNYTLPQATATTLGGLKIWTGTQTAYDAITTKDATVFYFIEKT